MNFSMSNRNKADDGLTDLAWPKKNQKSLLYFLMKNQKLSSTGMIT